MQIQPITKNTSCLGVMCQQHGECARYYAANGSQPGTQLGSCNTSDKDEYPLFAPMRVQAMERAGELAPSGNGWQEKM